MQVNIILFEGHSIGKEEIKKVYQLGRGLVIQARDKFLFITYPTTKFARLAEKYLESKLKGKKLWT